MNFPTGLDKFLVLVPILAVGYLALLFWMDRASRNKPKPLRPGLKQEIENALAAFLCGSPDISSLRAIKHEYPDGVRDCLLEYHEHFAGRRDELAELAIELGFLETWWWQTQSTDAARRREAFAWIASVARNEHVRQLVRDVVKKGAGDADEQIRLQVARIRLASGDSGEVNQVFESAIMETSKLREALSFNLREHAVELCANAIPWALRKQNPLEVLKMLVSWERTLPILDLSAPASHSDPRVRVEAMRLLRYLPATARNMEAIRSGLESENAEVRAAANETFAAHSSQGERDSDLAASPAH